MDQGPDTQLAQGITNEAMSPMGWLQNLDPVVLMKLLSGLLGRQPPPLTNRPVQQGIKRAGDLKMQMTQPPPTQGY